MNDTIGRGAKPVARGSRDPRSPHRLAARPNRRLSCAAAGGEAGGRAASLALRSLVVVLFGLVAGRADMALGAGPPTAPAGAAAAASPSPATAPAIEEWLNQSVRLRDTAQARQSPAADGAPAGEIRAGAEVKAIGLVAGHSWVQIELPNHALAYLPRAAIEFETGAAAPPAPQGAQPAATATATAATAGGAAAAAAGMIRGTVGRVANAATLVVADQRLRLSGIDPGPQADLAPFEKWVLAQGALACTPDAQTGRYHCLTGGGVDVAEAAILNGAGRVGDGASPAYRDSETQARNARRGLWGQP
jgi:endonuclease YncB( thermonuclease family)